MKEATHTLLQRGDRMQTKDLKHPPAVCDNMTNAYDTNIRAFWSDSKGGTVSTSHVWTGEGAICPNDQKCALQMQKQKNLLCIHQLTHMKNDYCYSNWHPGLKRTIREIVHRFFKPISKNW